MEAQTKFKDYTKNKKMLSTVFESDEDMNILTERFMKKLDGCISFNFKKIRINKKKVDKVVNLHSKLQELKEKDDKNSVKEEP